MKQALFKKVLPCCERTARARGLSEGARASPRLATERKPEAYKIRFPDVIPIYDTLKDFGLEVVQAPEEDDHPHEAATV